MGRRRMSLLEDSSNGLWGKKPKENNKQALAEIGQGHLISLWDSLFGRLNQPIAQILLTCGDLSDRARYLNAYCTLTTLLNHGFILMFNKDNTLSVSKIKFGDNDTLSAITASMFHAELPFLMTDVDCLYTENPLCSSTASSTHPSVALLGPPQPNPSPLAYETKQVRRAYFPPHPDPLAKTSCLADPRFVVPTSLLTLIHWLRPPVLPIQVPFVLQIMRPEKL
ncbi:hypothetical protein O181_121090 [Austropuccinia psidii MF-1]|uniref:Aspartate/glutamate/uridylate kinase domain-containing protein n=1 Tax=Austropuccinia psidii MF-1 TaxID=1389203 RepID=A0A9Q3Q1Z2_9BASI|nr:hypothetical protein [Austropuccinia psidii MF-1]